LKITKSSIFSFFAPRNAYAFLEGRGTSLRKKKNKKIQNTGKSIQEYLLKKKSGD